MSNQSITQQNNQNSNEQSTNQQDYSLKSYLQSPVNSEKLAQSKSIQKRSKKINDDEIKRIIQQSKVIKQYLDQEENLFEQQENCFYSCNYCGNEYQGRYDVDRHKKSVHPEEYCQDNPDYFQCQICFQAFHKSNCAKHIKACGNNSRERLRKKMEQSNKLHTENDFIGDFQTYYALQDEIDSIERNNTNQDLSYQLTEIEKLRMHLSQIKINQNSQADNISKQNNLSIFSGQTQQHNQTINFSLQQQPTKKGKQKDKGENKMVDEGSKSD